MHFCHIHSQLSGDVLNFSSHRGLPYPGQGKVTFVMLIDLQAEA